MKLKESLKNKKIISMNQCTCLFLSFLLAFIPRLILCCFYPPQMRLIQDEIGKMAIAAKLAGFNWDSTVNSTLYYGYGFFALLTPLFKFITDPYLLYTIIVTMCAAVYSLIAPISFHCMRKYFRVENLGILFPAAFLCSYSMQHAIRVITNEAPFALCLWLIIWILLALQENENTCHSKVKLTICLTLVLIYSLSVHTRAILIIAVIFGTIIVYFWVYKKWIVNMPIFIPLMCGGYYGVQQLNKYVQHMIWMQNSSSEALTNSSQSLFDSLFRNIQKVFILENWTAYFSILIGNIQTLTIKSGGIFMIIMIASIMLFLAVLTKKKFLYNDTGNQLWPKCILIVIMCFSGLIFTIIGLMLIGGASVATQIWHEVERTSTTLKVISYPRYYGLYFGPLLMVGIAWLANNLSDIKKEWSANIKHLVIVAFIFIEIFWSVLVVPISYLCTSVETKFSPFTLWKMDSEPSKAYLAITVVVCTIMLLVLGVLLKKKKLKIILWIVIFISVYDMFYYNLNTLTTNVSYGSKTYEVIKYLENECEVPSTIYVPKTSQAMVVQFMLNRYEIIVDFPSTLNDDILVITTNCNDSTYDSMRGFYYILLDGNEFLWTKSEEIYNIASEFLSE